MSQAYQEYLQFLSQLCQTLEKLTDLQNGKAAAARAQDLEKLNQCMKEEQAISLSIRGLEQRRVQLLKGLGLEGRTLSQVMCQCDPAYRGQVCAAIEKVQHQSQVLRSAQEMARTILEGNLHQVEEALKRKGVLEEAEGGYSAQSRPSSRRTDFRA